MQSTGCERQRLTAMIAVTASNELLPLQMIVKGKKLPKDVQDVQLENVFISASENAWMTRDLMLEWVQKVTITTN